MTARLPSTEMQRADELLARVMPPLIGRCWDVLPHEYRRVVAILQPNGDLSYLVDSTWNEISPRDRECLMQGFRACIGMGSLIEVGLR